MKRWMAVVCCLLILACAGCQATLPHLLPNPQNPELFPFRKVAGKPLGIIVIVQQSQLLRSNMPPRCFGPTRRRRCGRSSRVNIRLPMRTSSKIIERYCNPSAILLKRPYPVTDLFPSPVLQAIEAQPDRLQGRIRPEIVNLLVEVRACKL